MPQGDIYIERRQFKRVDKRMSVSYKIVSTPSEIETIKKEASKRVTETSNISIGGIQLIDDEKLDREQILRLEFRIEGRPDPIITFAEVRWCAKDSDINKFRVGIEFLVLKDEDKNTINQIIKESN